MSQKAQFLSKAASCAYGALLVMAAAPSNAALTLSDAPLFLTVSVPPNIVLTLDDSGSMRRAYVPELPATECPDDPSDCSVLDNRYWKAANKNALYYNPNVIYPVGKKADGTSWTTSFTAAYKNGFDTSLGTVDLSTSYRPDALYELKPTNSVTQGYMGHFSGDVMCNTGASGNPKYCALRRPNNSYVNTTTACSQITNSTSVSPFLGTTPAALQEKRDRFCRGTEDTSTSGTANIPAGVPAYYYVFNGNNTGCSGTTAQKQVDNDCYSIVIVGMNSGPGTKDLNGDGSITTADQDERQNFANWYSFARTRNLSVKTATSIAFSSLPNTSRVAWQALNTCRGSTTSLIDTDCDGYKVNTSNVSNAISTFTGTHKTNFYNWLYQLPTNSGTPLPDAMKRVGEYYRTSGENSPYDNNFSTSNSGELACRRNYHVMFTDGIWTTAVSVGDPDNTATDLPAEVDSVTRYTPAAPFKDDTNNTLADVAFKYWVEDSRNTLDDILTPSFKDRTGESPEQFLNPRNDPATWQHMVNFTIGLGLTGYLKDAGLTWDNEMYNGSYSDLKDGTKAWPAAGTSLNNPANVADLWHAAINSRGQFFSADDPLSLATAFQSSINAITAGEGSSTALASNSTSLNLSNTVIYQAKFAQDWSGTLLALPVAVNGTVGRALWDASDLIPAHGSRRIFTRNNSTNAGVLFNSCTNLSASQRLALNTSMSGTIDNLCEDRLSWLRGDASKEERNNNGPFRNRVNGVMGDILNSNPAYVKNVNYGYAGMPTSTAGQGTYLSYVSGNASRTAMVYVGANDGRMYGIDATTGVEKFSYIPGSIYSNLSSLTDPNYLHKYYVDGPVSVGDAYIGGAWKTMLVAGLNAGGKSVYALDVTNPDAFGTADVKWEFTEADMGFTFSQPQIGVLQNGQWVAVFGNGYNSTSGGAFLYIVDLATGALLRKITASNITGDESNGLSTPTLYDSDGDRLIDTVYAGDLLGNMWKFSVSGASSTWGVAYGTSPLFRARNSSGGVQPITAPPTVLAHPEPTATLVIFGTGRYLTASDLTDNAVQSLYGLRDAGSAITTTNRSELQEQRFDAQGDASERDVRTLTSNTVDYTSKKGYYLDFVNARGTAAIGERVTSSILVRSGKVIITSIIPNSNPCTPGGTSYLTETSSSSGGALSYCAIDIDGDLVGGAGDKLNDRCASSVELNVGLSNTALYLDVGDVNGDGILDDADGDGILDDGSGEASAPAMKFHTGTNGGAIDSTAQPPPPCTNPAGCAATPPTPEVKRRSWIQIR